MMAVPEDAEGVLPATLAGPYPHSENGPNWELAGTVRASAKCNYTLDVATPCDSGPSGACWTKFFVSAQTGVFGERYDSPVDSGYSVDNLFERGAPDRTQPIPHDPDEDAVKVTRLVPPEPNPASGAFVIHYDIATADWVRLEVYDVSGRRMVMLADGLASRGHHAATWDASGPDGTRAAPGMYFVRLLTSREAQTAKLVLLR
jgi:hypothetical protein